MTVVVAALIAIVGALSFLVAGLLRSHATILRRLHELDQTQPEDAARCRSDAFRPVAGIPEPADATGRSRPASLGDPVRLHRVPDIAGLGLREDAVVVRTSGSTADTILLFLSSGCTTCQRFWDELGEPDQVRLPAGARLLIVTKGPESESLSALSNLAPADVELVMSSQAWGDFGVPGSPYVVAVDGPTGRVKGEGTGSSWGQVAGLLAQATGDLSYVRAFGHSVRKPPGDAEREARVDRELLAAGILPGDPSLYAGRAAAPPVAVPAWHREPPDR